MRRKQFHDGRSTNQISDLWLGVMFLVFVSCAFLIMFSFADRISEQRSKAFESATDDSLIRKYDFVADNSQRMKHTWACKDEKCVKEIWKSGDQTSLNTCNMLCSSPALWPKPQKVDVRSRDFATISGKTVSFYFSNEGRVEEMLNSAKTLFLENIKNLGKCTGPKSDVVLKVFVNLETSESKLTLNTNESYKLTINKDSKEISANIEAPNYFGARHALETLAQLIWFDEVNHVLKILTEVTVEDFPAFPYRGVMVDTARNYFPISLLRKVVDGMAASKLNMFHLHLTDGQSFPVVLPRVAQLAEFGAYGEDMVYTAKDIKELISYALIRGVKVILEVDAPSHMNAGWEFSKHYYNENYVICGENSVFSGQINPDNDHVLTVLEDIYSDLLELTEDNDIFHMGGDEVDLNCWLKTDSFKKNSYKDGKDFWAHFENKILDTLSAANNNQLPNNLILWSSPLTNSPYLKDLKGNITVQFWLGDPSNILRQGYPIIYSTVGHWYLDCGFGMYKPDMKTGSCDPYTPWQTFYKYRPWQDYGFINQARGGEVCLWTEEVEVDTLETRIWPRAAAFAERVWSDPQGFDDYDVYTRLTSHRERLLTRGVRVSGMWPRWCSQHPGKC